MIETTIGMLVKSKAGHDKDKYYIVTRCEKEYLYLVDGRLRLLDNPKKKKRKHIQVINKKYDMKNITDTEIKKILKSVIKEGE